MANIKLDRPSEQARSSSASKIIHDKPDADRTVAIAETFRTLGLESEDARQRIRKLANPNGLEVGCRADNVDVETRNNTLVEAAAEHA